MTDLPDGWVKRRLDSVAAVTLGQSPPGASYNEDGDGVPFFQGKAEFGDLSPTVRKYTTAGAKFARAGDILISVRAPVGPTNLAPVDCAIGRGLAAIRASTEVDQRYLMWALRATASELSEKGAGSTFPAITGKQLKAHLVTIAPTLEEQQRIVTILEDHLSRLDAALASLFSADRRLSSLGEAVLRAELLGTSSSTLRLESHLADVGLNDGDLQPLPAGWKWSRLGDLADVVGGVTKDSKRQSDPGYVEVPYLRVANVQRGRLDLGRVITIRVHPSKAAALELVPGDVLLNEGGDRDKLGRGWIWEGQIPNPQSTVVRSSSAVW